MSRDNTNRSRRSFLKYTGVGSLGLVSALAGCTGGGGDGGGGDGGGGDGGGGGGDGGGGGGDGMDDGGDGGGDGGDGMDDGGDGGDGGATSSQDLIETNIILAPGGYQGIMMDHIVKDTNILNDEMNERGYTANVQVSWEGVPLFAAGGPDFSTMSSLEATRLGTEREIDLAVIARVAPLYLGWWAEKGGPFDPATTGSAQASMDKIVNEQATTLVGSWAGGDVPGYTMAIATAFNYSFTQGADNEFSTSTADYFAIPTLVLQGDAAAGGTSPLHGVGLHVENNEPQHVELFNVAKVMEGAGLGVPPLNSLTTTQQFVEEHRGAAEAYVRAWHRGMEWLFEDPMARILEDRDEHFQQLAIETEEQAQYINDWGVNLEYDNPYPYNYLDVELTDEFIEKDRNFLSVAEENGFVPSGWQDRVSFVQIPQE